MLTNFPPGKVLQAKVVSIVDYGIFVRMADGIEGLIPISEVVEDENNKIKLGDEVEAEISNVDVVDRRITLTMKDIGQHPVQEIAAPKAAQASTLGALIREKLGDKLDLKK
jgi:small subunit ribosomal protein S1